MLNDHFLAQCNHLPTRILNGSANVLDLILTRTPEFISNIEVLPNHFDSDHLPVALDSKCTVQVPISQLLGRFITLRKLLFLY